jgi:hypothetical protein
MVTFMTIMMVIMMKIQNYTGDYFLSVNRIHIKTSDILILCGINKS